MRRNFGAADRGARGHDAHHHLPTLGNLWTHLSVIAGQQFYLNNTPPLRVELQSDQAAWAQEFQVEISSLSGLMRDFACTRMGLLLKTRGGSISSFHT